MYDLYKEQCGIQQDKHVKESYYRFLFRTEFNMDFHVPKTDRCDHCEAYKVKKNENIPISPDEELSHINHLGEKIAMRYEKDGDKKK